MATIERRSNVTIAFINRKDFPAGKDGDKMHMFYCVQFGGFGAMDTVRNKAVLDYLKIKTKAKDIVLVVEEVAAKLDAFEIDTVIDHEIAHVKLGHTRFDPSQEVVVNGVVANIEYEVAADRYSAIRNGAELMRSVIIKLHRNVARLASPILGTAAASIYKELVDTPIVQARLKALDEFEG